VIICLERGANYLHMVHLIPVSLCHPSSLAPVKSRMVYLYGMLAYPFCPVKKAVNTDVVVVVVVTDSIK